MQPAAGATAGAWPRMQPARRLRYCHALTYFKQHDAKIDCNLYGEETRIYIYWQLVALHHLDIPTPQPVYAYKYKEH